METGKIIILNGSSSAGKTTLAHMLQQLLAEPFQHVALDQYRDGMPARFRGFNSPPGTPGQSGLNIVPTDHGGQSVTAIEFGEFGRRLLRGMRRSVAALATEGINVIVDDLMLEPEFADDYVDTLEGFDVTLVGVRCSLETVNKREATRPGRFPGTATHHFHTVHAHVRYDVEVDTETASPRECARIVIEALENGPRPRAIEEMRSRRSR